MRIIQIEKTFIPQTLEGKKFAYGYEKRLKEQGAFIGRMEDPQSIIIEAQHYFTISGEVEDGNDD